MFFVTSKDGKLRRRVAREYTPIAVIIRLVICHGILLANSKLYGIALLAQVKEPHFIWPYKLMDILLPFFCDFSGFTFEPFVDKNIL